MLKFDGEAARDFMTLSAKANKTETEIMSSQEQAANDLIGSAQIEV